jgi:hypothetical protein
MARLLVTTFNNPEVNLREALLFKQLGHQYGFLSTDRMDEIWDNFPKVLGSQTNRPGIQKTEYMGTKLFSMLSLSVNQGAAWRRLVRDHRETLSNWLASLYAEPIDCWVIGGHHHHQRNNYSPMCWGTSIDGPSQYCPYAGFGIKDENLEWFGYRGESEKVSLSMPGARLNLRNAQLLVVFGCNGIPMSTSEGEGDKPMAHLWRRWLAKDGRHPLILGWFNFQSMVPNNHPAHAVEDFWKQLDKLKKDLHLGADAFTVLCRDHPMKVVEAWCSASYRAYANSKYHQFLWGVPMRRKPVERFEHGCGAVLPDGTVYHANPKYVDADAVEPMIKIGKLT